MWVLGDTKEALGLILSGTDARKVTWPHIIRENTFPFEKIGGSYSILSHTESTLVEIIHPCQRIPSNSVVILEIPKTFLEFLL